MDWSALVQAASAAAQVAAQQEAAKSVAAANKAKLQQGNDQLNLSGYGTDKSIDLNALTAAANYALQRAGGVLSEQAANDASTKARAGNAVRGSVLENAQDSQVIGLPAGVPHIEFTGGLRPSMFDANTRALGAQMTRQALLDQMGGPVKPYSATAPTLDVSKILNMTAPAATPLPTPSTLDNILSSIGAYGAYAGAVSPYMLPKTKPTGTPTSTGSIFDPATGSFTE